MHTEYNWGSDIPLSFLEDYPAIKYFMKKFDSKTVIDLGCGNGAIDIELIKEGFDVYGLDSSISGIDNANLVYKKICPNDNTKHFYYQDFDEEISEEIANKKYDTVISSQVIEHVYSPKSYIKQCSSFLPAGGIIIITTPYHGYLKNLVLAITGKFDKHFTVLWEGGHIKFWSRNTLERLLNENGFRIKEFKGLGRFPYIWKSMLIVAEKL